MIDKEQFLFRLESGIYHEQPDIFIIENTTWTPLEWQKDCLLKLFCGERKKLAVSGGLGHGRTVLVSLMAYYFFLTRIPSKTIITGPSGKSTMIQVFHYLKPLCKGGIFSTDINLKERSIHLKDAPYEHFILWQPAISTKSIEGFMGPDEGRNILWIVEDAKSVEDKYLKLIESIVDSGEEHYLYINSIPPDSEIKRGFFSSLFRPEKPQLQRKDWSIVELSGAATALGSALIKARENWGESSSVYKRRILGEFV